MLFILFINDITQSVNLSSCHIFADDVVVNTTGDNINIVNATLQSNINDITSWYENNRLRIHPNETKIMFLRSRHTNNSGNSNILLDGTQLEQVNSVRCLGVEGDDYLTWELHVRNLCTLIAFKLHTLTRLRHTINRKLLDLLYKTSIQPCFD